MALATAFGTPHVMPQGSPTCGKVIHPVEFFAGGGFHQQPDLHYCNYLMLVGTQFAIATRAAFTHLTSDMAEARARGMKLVVVDPVGAHAANKADEWIPIRPGTDTAFALSLLHVLLNELELYDAAFLKHRSNASYLVDEEGHYVREPGSAKPMIYDTSDGELKVYDDPGLVEPLITGCAGAGRPTFELLREHVNKYAPEKAEEITTVPAETLRRLAKEFGEAMRVGSTIAIDGVTLPYRPACVDFAKGPQGHKHGFHQSWPLKLLNVVMGAVNVPGGILSTAAAGNRPRRWGPEKGVDGLQEEGGHLLPLPLPKAFPGRKPQAPARVDLGELFPLASHFHTTHPVTAENGEKFGLDYGIEVLIHAPINSLLSTFGDLKKTEAYYKSISFMAGFAVEINETNLFDDIVLPFPSYLERWDFVPGQHAHLGHCGKDDVEWNIRRPVVDPPNGMWQPQDVVLELADRLGILPDFYRRFNHAFFMKEGYALEAGQKYTVTQVLDRMARSWFGDEHDLDWFGNNGSISIPRDVEEAYIGPFIEGRLPIYLEHFIDKGRELAEVVNEMGIEWDISDYVPLSEWMPCDSYGAIQSGAYDFIAVHYKLPYVYGSFGNENPWLNELCERSPQAYSVVLNRASAEAKGIADGDEVWLESPVCKVRTRVKLTECIHPEVVGIAGHFGHWSPGMPIAKGKGINFNSLLPTDLDHIDKISNALDHCVEVKVYK
jgi:molybdopterin-containing oxidoreductase family molybdopterin binding subunit